MNRYPPDSEEQKSIDSLWTQTTCGELVMDQKLISIDSNCSILDAVDILVDNQVLYIYMHIYACMYTIITTFMLIIVFVQVNVYNVYEEYAELFFIYNSFNAHQF